MHVSQTVVTVGSKLQHFFVLVLCGKLMVPTVMESHGILASHGKSCKMERVMEKSWNFNHLFSEKIIELQK